tara:strand:- start:1875 stop:2531 length:657 start_codon:yes stop_codon:yes gene_type:complete
MSDNNMLINASGNTPLTDEEKKRRVKSATKHFGKFMSALGYDWDKDPNSIDTPKRVAKAYMYDLCSGCFTEPPKVTAFENVDEYDGIVAQCNIPVKSLCCHHFLPFTGVAHVAYIPNRDGKVIGLSKLNRLTEWIARRPSVQENLTMQISQQIDEVCEGNNGVAVVIKARHTCACLRGVKHDGCYMITSKLTGDFMHDSATRSEFYKFMEMAANPVQI